MIVFIALHFVKNILCDIRQFLLNTVIIVPYFVQVHHRVFVYRHFHVWVRYFDTTKIMVWYMYLILVHMTYFSIYIICISENYRLIVSYSPTPGQQVSAILWNITVTVWLQSQVHRVTYCFVLMHEIFTSQNSGTHYTVIILPYLAHISKT